MLRIGLTGGIAAGKSVASRCFSELGARVVDHDELAKKAVERGSAALADIAREFGDRLVTRSGLDRAALAEVVFSDDDARRRLNAIVHPYVFALSVVADRRAREEGVAVIVHDVPLLVEAAPLQEFDLVVTVGAPVELRIQRLVETRGFTVEQAEARIAAQATDEQRAAVADAVLDGSGPVERLCGEVDRFWNEHVPLSPPSRSLGE